MRSFLSSVQSSVSFGTNPPADQLAQTQLQRFDGSEVAMSDLYEVQFTWPSTEPNVVVVTGTFDNWSSSVPLLKGDTGFHGSARIPYDTKIAYKYVVDSEWVCETSSPIETDEGGNTNNVLTSPPRPSGASEPPVVTNGHASEKMETPAVVDSSSQATETTSSGAEAIPETGATLSSMASDFVDTVAARDGTTSALGYVTSALGAAIQSQIGVDPINGTKTAVESPQPDGKFIIPPPSEDAPTPEPPMAPGVPISIVPVNAGENNTSAGESPAAGVIAEVESSSPVETPSTHTPAPAVDTVIAPTPVADSSSVPEVVVETVAADSGNIEAEAPSALPVGASSEPPPIPEPTTIAPEPTPAPATSITAPEPTIEAAVAPAVVSDSTEPAVSDATSEPQTATIPTSEPTTTTLISAAEPAIQTVSPEPATAAPATTEEVKPSTNGTAPTSTSVSSTPVASPAASGPTTPGKKNAHAFPSSETESPSSSTSKSPSKFGTIGSRKNRKSIFGKIKNLFGNEKEEKEKK
ncbi:hypothetical protein C8R46DRAFT_640182 [Mycena filopes]|nr:hypothetical protein C8R46DRAFT_640182 [Mycena filopes]